MSILADGFEHKVLEARIELACPACKNVSVVDVMDLLRDAETTEAYAEEADTDFVQSYVGKIVCGACGLDVNVHFGHGEVQPAGYRFALYALIGRE